MGALFWAYSKSACRLVEERAISSISPTQARRAKLAGRRYEPHPNRFHAWGMHPIDWRKAGLRIYGSAESVAERQRLGLDFG